MVLGLLRRELAEISSRGPHPADDQRPVDEPTVVTSVRLIVVDQAAR
jgi:hypothetical protein